MSAQTTGGGPGWIDLDPMVYAREVLWLPLFGWGLATLDPIAIDRQAPACTAALRQILRTGSARLESGLGVIIVPEATRVRLGERRRDEPGGH
ncbi:MAG: 1-acyl-sn-glycerol-3-phosphate acyltransferase, partial [Gammaproteobacteria bacterium]